MNTTTLSTLYKMDSKGKIRIWQVEWDNDAPRYRTIAGLMDGKAVTSEWTTVTEAKSQPTLQTQAIFEAKALWQNKVDREYYDNLAEAQSGIPKMFEPMTAKKYGERKTGSFPAHAQPKLDGIRCVIRKVGGVVVAKSRENQTFVSIPHILDEVRGFFLKHPDLVLDGELYNHELKHEFEEITSIVRQTVPTPVDLAKSEKMIQFHIYDTTAPMGSVLDRMNVARKCFTGLEAVRFLPTEFVTNEGQFDAFHDRVLEEGYEGSMLRPFGQYETKRSYNLLKRKDFTTEEFTVLRVEEGVGNWAGTAKRVVIALDGAPEGECGCGTRGDKMRQAAILAEKARYEGNPVTVRYFGKTPDGSLRHPVVIDYHPNGRRD